MSRIQRCIGELHKNRNGFCLCGKSVCGSHEVNKTFQKLLNLFTKIRRNNKFPSIPKKNIFIIKLGTGGSLERLK